MPAPLRSPEARALRRRLLALAVGGLFGPLLALLGWTGWRQLAAERQLVRAAAGEELLREGRRAARGLEGLIGERIARGAQLVVDEDGRALAPGLPPEAGEVAALEPAVRAALETGRALEQTWGDRRAARDCFAALRERYRNPAHRAAAGLELLGSCAAAGDWPAVLACAETLLREHTDEGGAVLGRTEYLHAQLLRVEALRRLGERGEAGRVAGRVLLELGLSSARAPVPGAGFYRAQLAQADPPAPPAWAEPLTRALAAGAVPGPLRDAPAESARLLEPAGAERRAVGIARLEGDPARYGLGLIELEPLLAAARAALPETEVALLAAPGSTDGFADGSADGSTDGSADGSAVAAGPVVRDGLRARIALEGPLAGWTLALAAPPPVSALERQAAVLLGLVGAALLVLAGAVWLLLRDASRAVDLARVRADLVAGVAHDLKTPLSMIRLYAETLRLGRAAEPAERDRFLDVVIGEADRLADLVDDALSVARGQAPLQRDATDLLATVREAAAPLVPLAAGRLTLELADGLPALPHDPRALRRVVRNLLQNALKFAPRGPVLLRLGPGEAGGAQLSVSDQGPGIPPDALGRLGEPGFRAAPGTVPGTGLGLMIVRQLVDAHGGRLAFVSREGQGTCVTVLLPGHLPAGEA